MKVKTYQREYGEVIVEECTRKEFVELAGEFVDNAEWCDSLGIAVDDSLYIDYKDGSNFSYFDYLGFAGMFKTSRISFGVISNSATYQVFGKYTVNEDMVVEPA